MWLRGFEDLPSRAAALTAFYRGPVWARHRDAANATMVDSDDVLLLRPAPGHRGLRRGDVPADGRLLVTTYHLRQPADRGFLEAFTTTIEPGLSSGGGRSVGVYVTDPTPNNWPDLPVREGEEVLIALRAFGDEAEYRVFCATGGGTPSALPPAAEDLAAWLERESALTLLAHTEVAAGR